MIKKKFQNEGVYNFLDGRKWIFTLSGASVSKSSLYSLYVLFIFAFIFYAFSVCIMTILFVPGGKELTIRVLHMMFLLYFALGMLSSRVYGNESLKETARILKSEVYKGEMFDEEVVKILKDAVLLVRKISNVFAWFCWACAGLNLIVHPLTYFLFMYDEKHHTSPLKPFLPYPYYMPFDTANIFNLSASYMVNVLASVFIFGAASTSNDIYMSCVIQTKAQLQILNLSLRSIFKRALALYYREASGTLINFSNSDIFQEDAFHRCLTECLKENIKHHQAIIRYRNAYTKYISCSMVVIITCGSLTFATHIFLILEKPGLGMTIVYLVNIFAEMLYNFMVNYQGEQVFRESSALFESLYATPWIVCNKDFKQMLRLMMSYSLRPTKIKTVVFNISASLETFGDVMSGMYKVMNVLSN